MDRLKVGVATGVWACAVVAAACNTHTDETGIAELEAELTGSEAELPPVFEAADGQTWVRTRRIEAFDDSPERESEGKQPDLDLAAISLDEATEALRPFSRFGEYEYTLADDDARELAAHIQQIAREGRDELGFGNGSLSMDDEPAALEATREPGEGTDPMTEVEKKVFSPDERVNYNYAKTTYPFNNHGQMSGAGTCTAFKLINHYTAVTSAHCVHTGSGWKAPKSIRFGGQGELPATCYGVTVPGCWDGDAASCDYAVIRLRGGPGSPWCLESDYDVGYFGWQTIGSTVDGIAGAISGYPSEQLPAGWTYPTLAYHFRDNGWTTFTYPDRVFYYNDQSGGQSGTAYWALFDGVNHRVRGIAKGAHSLIYDTNQARKITSDLISWLTSNGGS